MKVKRINPEPEFNPITIELTFETESEAKAFYALFNFTKISFTNVVITSNDYPLTNMKKFSKPDKKSNQKPCISHKRKYLQFKFMNEISITNIM